MTCLAPNFFIVGAPKCGTTAFAENYLKTHPNIFMCTPKEPHFFNTDHPRHRAITGWHEYLSLFAGAQPEQRRRGDASVWYLYSREAIPAIRQTIPDALLLVFVRNPVEMAQSLHAQLVHSTYENVTDFERAWELQSARQEGRQIPPACREPVLLQYRDACSLGAQVNRLYTSFPREQVKLVFLDDIKADARKVYLDVLEFLGLPDDGRQEFPVVNANRQRRFFWLAERMSKPTPAMRKLWRIIRQVLGPYDAPAHRMLEKVDILNSRVAPRFDISATSRRMLELSFADDIALLERLTARDLSHWLPTVRVASER